MMIYIASSLLTQAAIEQIIAWTNGKKKLFRTIVTDFAQIDVNDNRPESIYKQDLFLNGLLLNQKAS